MACFFCFLTNATMCFTPENGVKTFQQLGKKRESFIVTANIYVPSKEDPLLQGPRMVYLAFVEVTMGEASCRYQPILRNHQSSSGVKATTSSIDSASVNSMTSLSRPKALPAAGGIFSNACKKGSAVG